MSDKDGWIEPRLSAALKAAATKDHQFPKGVADEYRKLLASELREPRKPAELEAIALRLGTANKGEG